MKNKLNQLIQNMIELRTNEGWIQNEKLGRGQKVLSLEK
jgi:hypothetical protein